MAADIYRSDLTTSILEDLPEQNHYYLSEGEGNLLNWHISTKGLSEEEVQEKYNSFFADIKARKHEVYHSSIIGMDGKERGVFYFILDNGWYSVITIPFSKLLEPMKDTLGNLPSCDADFLSAFSNVFNFGLPGKTQGGAL